VGKVQLIRQGLYWRVICRCQCSNDLVRRLYAVWDDGRENLGVLVPEEDGFRLDRRIPVKRLRTDGVKFMLSTGGHSREGKLVPVSPEEPFAYIDRLKHAFLETENGKIQIRIEENPETV
jgi:hypothetical protein